MYKDTLIKCIQCTWKGIEAQAESGVCPNCTADIKEVAKPLKEEEIMKTIKLLVEDEVWEKFFRLFSSQGERSQILRNFIYKTIRDEVAKKREERDEINKTKP